MLKSTVFVSDHRITPTHLLSLLLETNRHSDLGNEQLPSIHKEASTWNMHNADQSRVNTNHKNHFKSMLRNRCEGIPERLHCHPKNKANCDTHSGINLGQNHDKSTGVMGPSKKWKSFMSKLMTIVSETANQFSLAESFHCHLSSKMSLKDFSKWSQDNTRKTSAPKSRFFCASSLEVCTPLATVTYITAS